MPGKGYNMNELRIADWEIAISSWDYDTAVERARPLVLKWTQANIELYRELYLAREVLSRRGGSYKHSEGEPVKTWSDFCEEIGYTRRAVNARLKNFVPAELSETGTDTFLIENKKSKTDRMAESLVRIQEYKKTGMYPEGWCDEDEALMRRMEAEDRAARTAHDAVINLLKYKRRFRPSRDYFTEMLSREGIREISKFKIEDSRLRNAQRAAGDSVAQFLYEIDDLNERAKAAANLVVRLKDVINDSIEEAVQAAGGTVPYEVME